MCAAQKTPPVTLCLYNYCIYCIYTSICIYFITVTKIRYNTVDGATTVYTQGENKTEKSCTVLIEGKDTLNNCLKNDEEKRKEGNK